MSEDDQVMYRQIRVMCPKGHDHIQMAMCTKMQADKFNEGGWMYKWCPTDQTMEDYDASIHAEPGPVDSVREERDGTGPDHPDDQRGCADRRGESDDG